MTALIYRDDKKNIISVLIVHDPLCDIFRSSSNSWISWYEVKHQSKKAITAHFLQAIIARLQTQRLNDDRDVFVTRKEVFGNFLFAYCMRVYMLRNLHVHSMVATLFGKNILCWYANLFCADYHDQMGSKHGITKKEQSTDRRGDVSFTKDNQIHNKILRSLSRIRLDDDKDAVMNDIVTLFEMVNNERERVFNSQKDILLAFKDNYINDANGVDVYDMLRNRVTASYTGGRGVARQAIVDAAVANLPIEEDRQSNKETLRASMAGFGGLSMRRN